MKAMLALVCWLAAPIAASQINAGHGGAWFNPQTPGQGILVEVLPESRQVFVAWFTYASGDGTKMGADGQRWLTGQGPVDGDSASLALSITRGGIFDTPSSVETTPAGNAELTFTSCTSAMFSYALDEGLSGSFELVRISDGSHCQQLEAQAGLVPFEVASSRAVAFVDVSLVSMADDGPAILAHQTVLVEDGVITDVGPTASLAVPPGTEVISVANGYLMPGLVDTHTHLATNLSEFLDFLPPTPMLDAMADNQLALYLANGVTTIFNLGDFGEPLPRWAAEVRAGQRIGPTIYAAQYARGGTSTPDGGPVGRSVAGANDARSFTAAADHAGFDMMKVYNYTPAAAAAALVDEARARGMPVAGHIPQTVEGLSFLAAGDLDLLAHAEAFTWAVFGWGQRPEDLPPAIDAMLAGDVTLSTTLGIVETIGAIWCHDRPGIEAFWALPEVAYMSQTEVNLHHEGMTTARWNPGGCASGAYEPQVPYMYQLVRQMHAAGVNVVLGTDSPTVLGAAGFSALRELEALARAGLGNHDVLRIATRNAGDFIAAEITGAERFGRIAPGYRADLVLLDGNPVDSLQRIREGRLGVMARGHWRSAALLEALLADIRSEYATVRPPSQ